MCDCPENVTIGGYENQTLLKVPDTVKLYYNAPEKEPRLYVCVDTCLVDEIKELWAHGIETRGCCCGHNGLADPFININENDIDKAISLGYSVYFYFDEPERRDTIVPKMLWSEINERN